MPYFLPEGYVERLGAPQDCDLNGSDEWQNEVYASAAALSKVLGLYTILDFGCGAAVKLLKHFGGQEFRTFGVDLQPAVDRLRREHPTRVWRTVDDLDYFLIGNPPMDLLICSDVLEHVDDPDSVLELFKSIHPQWLVLSTPDRKLMQKYPKWGRRMGPPSNGCHVREWAFDEFHQYIESYFEIIRHWITNSEQCTQAIIARIRR